MADEPGGENSFNEVIRITANSDQFVQDLQKIEEAWTATLQRMNEAASAAGNNPIAQVAAASAIDIGNLGESLKQVTDAIGVGFNALSGNVTSTMGKLLEAIQPVIEQLQKVGSTAKEAASFTSEGLIPTQGGGGEAPTHINVSALSPEDADRLYQTIRDTEIKIEDSWVQMYDTLDGSSKTWFTRQAERRAKDLDDAKAHAEKEESILGAVYTKLGDMIEAAETKIEAARQKALTANKKDDGSAAIEEQQAQIRLGIREKLDAEFRKLDEARLAANKTTEGESTADFTREAMIKVDVAANVGKELDAIRKKQLADNKLADDESTAEFTRNYQIRKEVADKFGAELAAMPTAGGKEGNPLEALFTGLAKGSGFDEGLAGVASNIGSIIGQMTQWYLIFQAILGVINLIKEAVMALPDLFERGFEFLSKMQAKAEELQAVLATKVTLSDNADDNFKLAGDAADAVLLRLRRDAAGLNLDFDKLTVSYKDFIGAGGAALVKDLDEAVQATELMQRAIKGMTSDQRESKTIQQEIPQLLDGSVQQSSRLLQIMGYTKDQWLEVRAAAIEHNNLLPVLQERLSAFVKVGDALPGTWQSLTAQAQLFLDIIGSDLASSAFEKLTDYARQLSKYYLDHREQIDDIVTALGRVIGVFVDVVAAAVKLLNSTGLFKAILLEVIDPLIIIAGLITAQAAGAELSLHFVDAIAKLMKGDFREAWQEAVDAVKEYNKNLEDSITSTGKALGFKVPEGEGQDPLKISTIGSQLPVTGSTGELSKLNKQTADDLKEIKDQYEDIRTTAKASLDGQGEAAARTSEIVKAYNDQLRETKKLLEDNYLTILNNENITPQEKHQAGLDLQKQLLDEQVRHNKEVATVEREGRKAELEDALTIYRAKLSEIETSAEREIAINKDLEANHVITAKQGEEQRKQIYDDEYRAIVKHVNDSTTKLKELGAKDNQFNPQKDIGKAEVKDLRGNAAEDKKESAEEEREQEAAFRKMITAAQRFYAQELALQKEFHAEGLTNNEQYVQAVIAAEERKYTLQKGVYEQELKIALETGKDIEKAQTQLDALTAQHNDATLLDEAKLAQARRADIRETITHLQELGREEVEAAAKHKEAVDKASGDNAAVKRDQLELLKAKENLIDTDLRVAEAELEEAKARGVGGEAIDKQIEKIQKLIDKKQELQDQINADGSNTGIGSQLAGRIFGQENVDTIKDPDVDGVHKFAAALNAATDAIGVFKNFLSNIKQGEQQGGTLGGIGAGLSTAAQYDPEPISHAILQIAGTVTSLIGGFLTSAARALAEELKKQFDTIVQKIQDNAETLGQGIKDLEAEKEKAISELSNKKGGQDELAKLVPEFDKQIAQLKNQQKQIIDNFNDQVTILKQQTDVGQKWLSDWKDINAEVKKYLDAGGNPNTAIQFLNEKLAAETLDLQNQYNTAEQAAIQDAFKLNDMLDQRVKLQESITKNLDDQKKIEDEISKISASENDSIVRRQAGAITAAQDARDKKQALEDQLTALKTQQADDQKQLTDLNASIDLQTIRVAKEKEVFGLTSDIASLHRLDEQLSLEALDQEVAKWKEMKALLDNLKSGNTTFDPNNPLGLTGPQASDFSSLISALKGADTRGLKDNSHNTTIPEIETTIGQFQTGFLSLADTINELKAEKADLITSATDKNHRKALADVSPSLDALIAALTKAAANAPPTPVNQPFPDAPGQIPGVGPTGSASPTAPPVLVGGPAVPIATAEVQTAAQVQTAATVQTLSTQLNNVSSNVQTSTTQQTSALTATLNTQLNTVNTSINVGSTSIGAKLDQQTAALIAEWEKMYTLHAAKTADYPRPTATPQFPILDPNTVTRDTVLKELKEMQSPVLGALADTGFSVKQMQTLINTMLEKQTQWKAAPASPPSIVIQSVHVGAGVDPYQAGKQVAGGIWDEFNYRYRAGVS